MSTEKQFRVSIVVPTLNSARTIEACLAAIRSQSFPQNRLELIIADAGSTDDTLNIARRFNVSKVVNNPLKTGEAGKTAGIKAATGDIIALIDSDNIMEDSDWLRKMTEPFADPEILGTEPLQFTWRKNDPALTRYFAMLGMNDPLCLFLGNYDRLSLVTGKWTGLEIDHQNHPSYIKIVLTPNNIPTIGANGFVFRRSLLNSVTWDPYFFDIDIIAEAVMHGQNCFAKVKCGIAHLYCSKLSDFIRKQDRRIKDFLFFSNEKQRRYPWHNQSQFGVLMFCICTVTVIPLLLQMIRGARRKADMAWWFHVPACWITLWIYGVAVVKKLLGFRIAAKPRDNWQPKL
ncbi:MAG: glycosyltransferase [Lentisphaerae bacterium]|nr:glycosyltransferase [Lentisphaerota bacterium]